MVYVRPSLGGPWCEEPDRTKVVWASTGEVNCEGNV
jgi:hypothetical protein